MRRASRSTSGMALVAAALLLPLAVSLAPSQAAEATPRTMNVTSSPSSVPVEARSWLGKREGAARAIDMNSACDDLMLTPEVLPDALSPAADLDGVTRDVAARLGKLYTKPNQRTLYHPREHEIVEPALRLRGKPMDDVLRGENKARDTDLVELLARTLPADSLIAYVSAPQVVVFAVAEPLDEAAKKLVARFDVIAPRLACVRYRAGERNGQPMTSGARVQPGAHDAERIVNIDVSAGTCEFGMAYEIRLVRRGATTFIVGNGAWTPEGDRETHEKAIADALTR